MVGIPLRGLRGLGSIEMDHDPGRTLRLTTHVAPVPMQDSFPGATLQVILTVWDPASKIYRGCADPHARFLFLASEGRS